MNHEELEILSELTEDRLVKHVFLYTDTWLVFIIVIDEIGVGPIVVKAIVFFVLVFIDILVVCDSLDLEFRER
jgi:hypothetical protein